MKEVSYSNIDCVLDKVFKNTGDNITYMSWRWVGRGMVEVGGEGG